MFFRVDGSQRYLAGAQLTERFVHSTEQHWTEMRRNGMACQDKVQRIESSRKW